MTDTRTVARVLQRAIDGNIPVTLVDPTDPWEGPCATNVGFRFGAWTLVIFCDVGDYDYIDHVVSPRGVRTEHETLYGYGRANSRHPESTINMDALVALLKAAR